MKIQAVLIALLTERAKRLDTWTVPYCLSHRGRGGLRNFFLCVMKLTLLRAMLLMGTRDWALGELFLF
jgi:hypothetical protein